MPEQRIYMDNHATTRVDPRVVEAMLPYFTEKFGNPGSVSHSFGAEAADAVEVARESIASAVGASPREIIFTSGATESNNHAIRGVTERQRRRGDHLISVVTEHKAVLDPLERLGRRGFEITLLEVAGVDSPRMGIVDPRQVADAMRDDTVLVSVMLANNEVRAVHPVAEIGRICKERGVLLHCDATQGVGKMNVDVGALHVDLMSFSSHKLYGPKGVGALYVRRRQPHVRLQSQIDGGGQEGGLRSGTLNVPGIVGFAKAVTLCIDEMATERVRLDALRGCLYKGLQQRVENVTLNGPAIELQEQRLPGNLNVSFADVDGEALMMNMRRLAVSSGSACTSANPEPSHVLRALGIDEDLVRASLRFGLGRFNTESEVEVAVETVAIAVDRLRRLG